jgi:hypothetical protein
MSDSRSTCHHRHHSRRSWPLACLVLVLSAPGASAQSGDSRGRDFLLSFLSNAGGTAELHLTSDVATTVTVELEGMPLGALDRDAFLEVAPLAGEHLFTGDRPLFVTQFITGQESAGASTDDPGSVSATWDGARVLRPEETFRLLMAAAHPASPFDLVNGTTDTSRSFTESSTEPLLFFDLRVANACDELPLDEFPPTF